MKIKYLLIAILVSSNLSCSEDKSIEIIEYTAVDYPIETGYDGTNFYFVYTLQQTDSGEYIFYADPMLKRITQVDFEKQKVVRHYGYQSDKFGIKGANEIITTDSAFILKNSSYFYWLTFDNGITRKKNTDNFSGLPFRNESPYSVYLRNSNQHQSSKQEHIVSHSSPPSNYDSQHFETPILSKIYLAMDSIAVSKEKNPARTYLNKGETFGYRSNPFVLQNGKTAVVSFPFTPDIFTYDAESLELKGKLEFNEYLELSKNDPILYTQFKDRNSLNKSGDEAFERQTYYHNIYFDPFRELYYRPVALETSELEKSIEYKMWLLVFDSELNLHGKLDLEDHYAPFLYISKTGLYIRKKKQEENKIDLVRLDFEIP